MSSQFIFPGKALALFLAFYPAQAFAQQFGLPMGATVEQVKAMGVKLLFRGTGPGTWKTDTLPYGNPQFDEYVLQFSKTSGLCSITAYINNKYDTPNGERIKSQYYSLKDSLTLRYGVGRSDENLSSGSIWREENEFMMSLHQNERRLDTDWFQLSLMQNKKDLQSLSLYGRALSPTTSYVAVMYFFRNIRDCVRESNVYRDSNL